MLSLHANAFPPQASVSLYLKACSSEMCSAHAQSWLGGFRELMPSGAVLPQSGDPAILAFPRVQHLPTEMQGGILGVNGLKYVCQANTVTDSTVLTSKVFPSSLREAPSQAARRHGQPLDEPARALSAAGVRSMHGQVSI